MTDRHRAVGAWSERYYGPHGILHLARDRADGERAWHIWLGPLGLHIFWPDWWHSRPDWCPGWREPM